MKTWSWWNLAKKNIQLAKGSGSVQRTTHISYKPLAQCEPNLLYSSGGTEQSNDNNDDEEMKANFRINGNQLFESYEVSGIFTTFIYIHIIYNIKHIQWFE